MSAPTLPDRQPPDQIAALRRDLDSFHEANTQRFEEIEASVSRLEKEAADSRRDRVGFREELDANTVVTRSIKSDTATLVSFSRGAGAFKRFLIWFLPLLAAGISAYVTYKSVKPS